MRYRFEDFEFRTDSLELFKAGKKRKLQRQPAKLLALLIERPGQVLGREEILAAIWGKDTFIEVDSNINFAVRQLRLALSDSAANPQFIETLPRLGYRFVAGLEERSVEPKHPFEPSPPQPQSLPSRGSAMGDSNRWAPRWIAASLMVLFSAGALSWVSGRRPQEPPVLVN